MRVETRAPTPQQGAPAVVKSLHDATTGRLCCATTVLSCARPSGTMPHPYSKFIKFTNIRIFDNNGYFSWRGAGGELLGARRAALQVTTTECTNTPHNPWHQQWLKRRRRKWSGTSISLSRTRYDTTAQPSPPPVARPSIAPQRVSTRSTGK